MQGRTAMRSLRRDPPASERVRPKLRRWPLPALLLLPLSELLFVAQVAGDGSPPFHSRHEVVVQKGLELRWRQEISSLP